MKYFAVSTAAKNGTAKRFFLNLATVPFLFLQFPIYFYNRYFS